MFARRFLNSNIRRFMSAEAQQQVKKPVVEIYASNTSSTINKSKPYLNAPHPQLDLKAYKSTTKFAMIWVFSLSLFAGVCGIFGYSLWWHMHREEARLAGRDLDQWLEEFEKRDPVVLKMQQWGLQNQNNSINK